MYRFIKQTGLLAVVALFSTGCGSKKQADMQPAPEVDASTPTPSTIPYSPVSTERISEDLLDNTRRATLEEQVHFGFDQSDLTPAAREQLVEKAEVLRAVPSVNLRIEGHADERGSDEYNLALSSRRAAAAKRFLVSLGISAERLETAAYGEEQPLDQAETEEAWARNRRDEFRVVAGRLAQQ